MNPGSLDWGTALLEALLPELPHPGAPVRLDCNDAAIAAAGRGLGVDPEVAGAALVDQLRSEKLLSDEHGMHALAASKSPDVRQYVCGLALTVWAASRMEGDDGHSMADYYLRLSEITGLQLRDSWPRIDGIEQVVAGFQDLARWMDVHEHGRRGRLDLPPAPSNRIVGIPVSQSLIRAGDRRTLSQFFQKEREGLSAGWDPVRMIKANSIRHRLSGPLTDNLYSTAVRRQLTQAIQNAFANWDGVVIEQDGTVAVQAELRLHLDLQGIIISARVPGLERAEEYRGPRGEPIQFSPESPTAIPLEWLSDIGEAGLGVRRSGKCVRLFEGDPVAFAPDELGFSYTTASESLPMWTLTADEALISSSPEDSRITGRGLPEGWIVICDFVLPPNGLRREPETSPAGAVELLTVEGALRLGPRVWLAGHPPTAVFHLHEPVSMEVDGEQLGYVEDGDTERLESIGSVPGSHTITVGDDHVEFEVAERGERRDLGSIVWSELDVRGFGSARLRGRGTALCGAAVSALTLTSGAKSRLNLRIQRAIDVICIDGSVEHRAAPLDQGWLSQMGLPQPGLWTVGDRRRVAWLCVDSTPRQVIAISKVEVPVTDAVCDLLEWIGDDAKVIDRSGGGGVERWERLQDRVRDEQ